MAEYRTIGAHGRGGSPGDPAANDLLWLRPRTGKMVAENPQRFCSTCVDLVTSDSIAEQRFACNRTELVLLTGRQRRPSLHGIALAAPRAQDHGGAGFTLSWGCAEEVAELVDRHR